MIALPPLADHDHEYVVPDMVPASPRSWLPMSDASAVSLGEWFLADPQARSVSI